MTANELIERFSIKDVDTIKSLDWGHYALRPWKFFSDKKTGNFKYVCWIQINSQMKFKLDNETELEQACQWFTDNMLEDEEFFFTVPRDDSAPDYP